MRRYTIHIVLFILTVASTLIVGGPAYSFAIILILLGHEMGHYLTSRRYGIRATLPFFLPFPLPPFGTLGAVIRMESTVSTRKALFDTGVAGPLTSLLLSIPAIVIGLRLSEVLPASQIKEGALRLADPLLFSFIQRLVLGEISENYEILTPPHWICWMGRPLCHRPQPPSNWTVRWGSHCLCSLRKEEPTHFPHRHRSHGLYYYILQSRMASLTYPIHHLRLSTPKSIGRSNTTRWKKKIDRCLRFSGLSPLLHSCSIS